MRLITSGDTKVGSWLWRRGNVIGQATAAMFVWVELRDLCGREARAGEGPVLV